FRARSSCYAGWHVCWRCWPLRRSSLALLPSMGPCLPTLPLSCMLFLLPAIYAWMSGSQEQYRAFQKSDHPSESLLGMRRKAAKLASDIGDLVKIHQSEHQRIEDSEHLSHCGDPNGTPI